jgi:enolase
MSVVEDIAVRNLYFESRNVLEIDLITANSFGRVQIKSGSDIDDLNAVVVPELIGLNVLEQPLFDDILSDVVDEGRVKFGFSLACAKAASTFVGLGGYSPIAFLP